MRAPVLYNRQYHTDKDPKKDERKTLDALEEGKSADEKQKYEDAGCYMVHCADQMSDGNPAKAAALASQQRGASDTTQQEELASTGLFKYDPVIDPWTDSVDRFSDQSAVRGAKDFGDQLLTKLRQGLGAQAPADDLTNASNGGTGTPPTPAVVTPSTPLMTPAGPVIVPGIAIPGSPGYVPPTATVSSGNDDSAGNSVATTGSSKTNTPNGSNIPTKNGNITFDDKIAGQLQGRGWTEQDIRTVIDEGPVGSTMDSRSAKKTPDGLPRNDTASVYGSKNGYVVVNDRTGEIVQVSGKNDPGWVPDSRIIWK